MKRTELLDRLDMVRPALSADKQLDIGGYSRFKFDKKTVLAFDDIIAMEVPCDILLEGAVEGAFLIEILNRTSGEIDSFERKEEFLEVTCKVAKYDKKTGDIIGYEDHVFPFDMVDNDKGFLFSFPSTKGCYEFEIDSEMKGGLVNCLVSASDDTSKPQQMGIYLDIDEDQIGMYSTNNVSLSAFYLNIEKGDPNTFILPVDFCRQLIRFLDSFDEGTNASIFLKKSENIIEKEGERVRTRPGGYVIAEVYNEDRTFKGRLFSRLGLKLKNYLNYQEVIEDKLEDILDEDYVEIPQLFEEMLQQAISHVGKDREASCLFSIVDKKIRISPERMIKGDQRKGDQKSKMSDDIDLPDIDIWTSPRLVHDALKYCDRIFFTDTCLIMRGGENFTYVVASHDK